MIVWDESIEEYVGLDLNGVEHFGQTWSECAARVSEANEVIAKHRTAQGFQRCPICGEPEFPGHFERCVYEDMREYADFMDTRRDLLAGLH